jgi:hypothetical protein
MVLMDGSTRWNLFAGVEVLGFWIFHSTWSGVTAAAPGKKHHQGFVKEAGKQGFAHGTGSTLGLGCREKSRIRVQAIGEAKLGFSSCARKDTYLPIHVQMSIAMHSI